MRIVTDIYKKQENVHNKIHAERRERVTKIQLQREWNVTGSHGLCNVHNNKEPCVDDRTESLDDECIKRIQMRWTVADIGLRSFITLALARIVASCSDCLHHRFVPVQYDHMNSTSSLTARRESTSCNVRVTRNGTERNGSDVRLCCNETCYMWHVTLSVDVCRSGGSTWLKTMPHLKFRSFSGTKIR